MKLPQYNPPQVVWRVVAFGRQRVPAGRTYWYDNRQRQPGQDSVIQATLGGQILYRDAAGQRVAGPGSILLFNYAEASSYGQPQPLQQAYECLWVNVHGAGLREHLNVLRQRHGSVLDVGLRSPLIRQMDELLQMLEVGSSLSSLECSAALYRFVLALLQHAQRAWDASMPPVQRAVEAILQQPQQPWSLKALANQYGCSREHLSRVFRQRTGQTPAAYLNEQKLNRALRLITQTSLSMRAVAQQCGFSSVHTMTRQVRTRTGQPPRALRKPDA